jgi:hypothetical protein
MMNIRRTVTALLMLIGMNTLVWAQGLTLTSKDISGQLSINEVFNGFGCTARTYPRN